MKGVPIRIQFGVKDLNQGKVTLLERHSGKEELVEIEEVKDKILEAIPRIQKEMLDSAKMKLDKHIKIAKNWGEFMSLLQERSAILTPW